MPLVTCGVDALIRDGFAPLQGARVGLVTNHTGLTVDGRATADVLHQAPGVHLTALFGPEHGIRGDRDERIGDGTDAATGLPVYSLYGDREKPTPEQCEGLDALVFDIQDIGCRFYTYISTLLKVVESADEGGLRVVVLDRPNPIGGQAEGPLPDALSFTACHPIPVRHGLTVGELARLFHAERGFSHPLTVIPCEGWGRSDFWDVTGLVWTDPSPNMRTLTAALLYPGLGLLEFTNLSVGRGTDRPFEQIGAPWIEPRALAQAFNSSDIPGVRAIPRYFTPAASVHVGTSCGGVSLLVTDREAVQSVLLGVRLGAILHRLWPGRWQTEKVNTLLAHDGTRDAIFADAAPEDLRALWADGLADFARRAVPARLYPLP